MTILKRSLLKSLNMQSRSLKDLWGSFRQGSLNDHVSDIEKILIEIFEYTVNYSLKDL